MERSRDLDQLRGYEGNAAAYYFAGVKTFFDPAWGFETRNFFPPLDPANALLSFAYAMLTREVTNALLSAGLDPYLGYLHVIDAGKPALTLDMMEEFRPIIADIVVLTLVREGTITLDDFEWTNDKDRPVRLSRPASTSLIKAFEMRLQDKHFHWLANGQITYRQVIEHQARHMGRVVEGKDAEYFPHQVE